MALVVVVVMVMVFLAVYWYSEMGY